MEVYRHTQTGTILLVLMGIVAVICGVAIAAAGSMLGSALFVSFFSLFLFQFGSLTVEVSSQQILVLFGIGLLKKKLDVKEVESCTTVKNSWFYGWGIRKIPKGWLYNVSGLDAVELKMRNGSVYRIGTDQPETLRSVIEQRIS